MALIQKAVERKLKRRVKTLTDDSLLTAYKNAKENYENGHHASGVVMVWFKEEIENRGLKIV